MEIVLHTIPEVYPALHRKLEQAVIDAAAVVDDRFGWCVDKLEIEVYTSRSLWMEQHTRLNEEELASWVAGDSGRIIRVVAAGSERHLLRMVAHECVHFIVRQQVKIIPAWLDEGIALFLPLGMPEKYQQDLVQAISHGALIPYELLARPFAGFDRSLKTLAYAQSCGMVRHIVETHGWNMLRGLLISLASGISMDQTLRPFGLNMYLLESAMKRAVFQEKEYVGHV